MSSVNHEDINLYVVTPSLDPTAQGPFLKRSEARALMALWEDAVRVVDKDRKSTRLNSSHRP